MNPTNPGEIGEAFPQSVPSTELDATRSYEQLQTIGRGVGDIAVHNEVSWSLESTHQLPLRTVEIDGRHLETDLPENVNISLPEGHFGRPFLTPAEFDKLPAGFFEMTEPAQDEWSKPRKEQVIITEADGIKRIMNMSDRRPLGVGANKLMEDLGYSFETYTSTMIPKEVPTPSSLKEQAAKLGVEVQLFHNETLIPPKPFLETFRDGKFPVALGSTEYYGHDVSDDHLTTMVLGGEKLRDTLAEAAGKALDGVEPEAANKAADAIDRYTATMRRVINAEGIDFGPDEKLEYSPTHGRETLQKIGYELGIPADNTNEILAIAQAKAAEYGIVVKQLA